MSGRLIETVFFGVAALLSLLGALLHRALASASPARLEELNDQHRRYKALPDIDAALLTAEALKLFVYTILIILVARRWADGGEATLAACAASVLVAAALVLGCEAVALVAAGYHSGHVLYRFLPVVSGLARVGEALRTATKVFAEVVARLSGREGLPPPEEEAEEEMLDAVSQGEREGVIKDQEREMIESIIEFKDAEVSEIMTPRTDLTIVNAATDLREAMETVIRSGHSRLPVATEDADNIVGILHVKDILQQVRQEAGVDMPVRELMRSPHFVPETKRIRELLQEFRATNVHLAIVLDEYGGTAGIVSIEDILEEIVGEIEDEYDEHQPPEIRLVSPKRAFVSGQAAVGDVNDRLGTSINEEEEYDTIAGFVLFRTGKIPLPGEVIELDGLRFAILEADERHIKHMAVEFIDEGDQSPPARSK